MTIPTYQEYLKGNRLYPEDPSAEQLYKELLSKIIRVALNNMMLNVHQNQKEASVDQLHSLAVMFHTMSSSFVVTKKDNNDKE